MTKQRAYQLRQHAKGNCIICGHKVMERKVGSRKAKSWLCEYHRMMANIRTREAQRKARGLVTRYNGSESYLYG